MIPDPEPLPGRWRRISTDGAGRLRLKNRAWSMEASAVADDVIRIRLVRGSEFPAASSWAITHPHHAVPDTRSGETNGWYYLASRNARLSIHRESGAWGLRNAAGKNILTGPAGGLRFRNGHPELAWDLPQNSHLFGLGESTGPVNKYGLRRELWNIDILGHAPAIHPGLRNLYVSIPFVWHLNGGRCAALFWDFPGRMVWDLGESDSGRGYARAEADHLDLYLFAGADLPAILARYTRMTGRIPMPPRWALGYHQCRYSYESGEELEGIARQLRQKRIPCDALYLDIHHMRGFRVFTFGKAFPRPAAMIDRLHRQGFRVVTIVDPGVKDDPQFGVLRRGLRENAFVKAPGGKSDFLGEVWPGRSRFPDFLNSRARRWWIREQAGLFRLGVDGIWNDMNEPATFDRPDKTLDPACIHASELGPVEHASVHNIYGREMARTSREGALRARPTERPFIISRAGWAGIQSHALVWTGDNSSCWEHMADSLQMLLNLGLSGVAFCGSDAGGFLDNPTAELFTRWIQMAAFTPFLRNHTSYGTNPQEPWAFGQKTERICRETIRLRYRLIPYLYRLFLEARESGAPIMRPLAWHYPEDQTAVSVEDQFLLGPFLLVAPVLRPACRARVVYLPNGTWFDFRSGKRFRGPRHFVVATPLEHIPVFVRAGAILSMQRAGQYIGEFPQKTVELHLWPEARGTWEFYEDDGCSLEPSRHNSYRRHLLLKSTARGGTLHMHPAAGDWIPPIKRWKVFVHAPARRFAFALEGSRIQGGTVAGAESVQVNFAEHRGPIRLDWK